MANREKNVRNIKYYLKCAIKKLLINKFLGSIKFTLLLVINIRYLINIIKNCFLSAE